MNDEDLRTEISRLRAGESDAPPAAGAVPTPAEWIRRWNDLTPEHRLRQAAISIYNAEQASRCFLMGHEGDAEELREQAQSAHDRREILSSHFRLVGDEDCGVGIHCRGCADEGRPLAHYDSNGDRSVDPLVPNVTTIPALLEAAWRHRADAHSGEETPSPSS